MFYVLLARECLSYLRWYAMHSNELQTGSRVSRTGRGKGARAAEDASRGKWNKNKCEGYDERDGKKNERYGWRNGIAGVVKMKGTTIKDTRRIGARNKKENGRNEDGGSPTWQNRTGEN